MTPAVKLALAYAYATGELPSKMHLGTWSAAYAHVQRGADCRYKLSAEALEAIARHPLKLAVDWFIARGFTAERSQRRRTSHYVEFSHERELSGLAYRSGGGTVSVKHKEAPYVTRFDLMKAEAVWPAILRPGMYAGEQLNGETGRAYIERATAAYKDSDNGNS